MPFHDVRFTAPKIAKRLSLIAPLVYRRGHDLLPLELKYIADPAPLPDVPSLLAELDWLPLPPDTYWGGPDKNFLLRGSFAVPTDFNIDNPIALFLPIGDAGDFSHPEALAYIDGKPYAAADRHHQEILIPEAYRDGESYTLLLHGWTGLLGGLHYGYGQQLRMQTCSVVEVDPPTRQLITIAKIALQTANLLDEHNPIRDRLYNALDDAFKQLDLREPFGDRFYESVPSTLEQLQNGIVVAGPALDVDIIAAGHAHIDVAWLWTLDQTRRKSGRTFHNVMRNMEQFPNFHFTQSQPQLYAYVQEDYPELFEDIKQRVAEGRWEPIGGMWVEADCNISGPESLVRQFLLGRKYFAEHFGEDAESPVLWLPDVFGYAWNLPQLIKKSGLEYFFTIKISWNQYNQMPYDSFWWRGLDGTEVLTHFSTVPEHPWVGEADTNDLLRRPTYNADVSAFAALGAWANLKHKEAQNLLLMSYGYGDGGGGPTREMNENAQVLADFPGVPRIQQGKVIDFFRRLEAESGDKLPVWNAELYLEMHRGTYTSQARNKRANRKSEFLLHDAEFLATYAKVLDPEFTYPHDSLNKAWELVCLNQFHDIIPGSSIHEVYVDSQAQYEQVFTLGQQVIDTALDIIREHIGGDVIIINPTSFMRSDLALYEGEVLEGKVLTFDGVPASTQSTPEGLLVQLPAESLDVRHSRPAILPYGIRAVFWEDATAYTQPTTQELTATDRLLENDWLRVEIDENGDICRILHKLRTREVLPNGVLANQWQAFEDRPMSWDAWDVDIFYDDKMYLAEPAESITLIESGPLRATIEIKRRILNSSYTQRISLQHDRAQIDISTEIDWRERHIFLKAAFPTNILSPVATHEVQWGYVQRPTHRNTSWDWARFETAAQKWVTLEEDDFGVALINDGKYGYDVHDNVIRISLLRSSTHPDPDADQGLHQFNYSLLPYPKDHHTSFDFIAQQSYKLNDPLRCVVGSGKKLEPMLPLVNSIGAIVETIKWAEDGNGIIVRLYRHGRQRGWIRIFASVALKAAYITNLMEVDQETLTIVETDALRPQYSYRIDLYLKPFEIVTVRLVLA